MTNNGLFYCKVAADSSSKVFVNTRWACLSAPGPHTVLRSLSASTHPQATLKELLAGAQEVSRSLASPADAATCCSHASDNDSEMEDWDQASMSTLYDPITNDAPPVSRDVYTLYGNPARIVNHGTVVCNYYYQETPFPEDRYDAIGDSRGMRIDKQGPRATYPRSPLRTRHGHRHIGGITPMRMSTATKSRNERFGKGRLMTLPFRSRPISELSQSKQPALTQPTYPNPFYRGR